MRGRACVAVLAAAVCVLAGLSGCARAGAPASRWSTALAWGAQVARGWQGGTAVGPLGAAVAPGRIAVLDSFADRLLVWSWVRGRWQGPEARALPSRSPLVAVALARAGEAYLAAVADGDGAVWEVSASGVRALLALPSSPGDLRRVVALAYLPGGELVADVAEVTAERSTRQLLLIPRDGAPSRILEATIARADAAPPPGGAALLAPPGLRAGLSPAGARAVWLAAARGSTARLVRLGLTGRILASRPLPVLQRPADLLGIDANGLAYALSAVGTPGARLVAFDGGARIRRSLAVGPDLGPLLPHPAAVDAQGAIVLLTASSAALRVRWIPPGGLARAAP